MERILLIGANGFLGSRFYKVYKDKYEILPLTSNELDVRSREDVINTIITTKPNYVLNTAAIISTELCEKEKEFTRAINLTGNINVAEGCKIAKSKMIYLSTEQVYNGNKESGPYSEDIKAIPSTNYGAQKLEGEQRVKEILNNDLWILRLCWLFGLPEKGLKNGTSLISGINNVINNGTELLVPANEYRGMMYIYDLIYSLENIFKIPYGTYNFGCENNLSNYQIAEIMLDNINVTEKQRKLIVKDTEKYKENPRDLRMDMSKIKGVGVKILKSEESLFRCLDDFNLLLNK